MKLTRWIILSLSLLSTAILCKVALTEPLRAISVACILINTFNIAYQYGEIRLARYQEKQFLAAQDEAIRRIFPHAEN